MMHAVSSELRKLVSVRSTYVLLGFCLLITILFAFYIEGYHVTANVVSPNKLAGETRSAVTALAFLISLVGILLVTHEYRYNTIMYTLTASRSRLKVLLAKVLVVAGFAVLATLFFAVLAPVLTTLGLHLKGISMVPQHIPVLELLWHSAFYGWAYSMLALVFAFIIRNQIGAIVVMLFVPNTIEGLLSLLLKDNAVYLPFTALNVLNGEGAQQVGHISMSPERAAVVAACYVVGGLIIAGYLFKTRDAN